MRLAFIGLLSVACAALGNAQAMERQLASNWCWAAAVQDVVAQKGRYFTQQQIAAVLDGWPRDRPAYVGEVVALSRAFGLRAWQVGRPGSPQELLSTVRSGWKVIAFVRPSDGPVGHYIVLQGIDNQGAVIVSDPWTGSTYRASLSDLYYRWRWSDSVVVG